MRPSPARFRSSLIAQVAGVLAVGVAAAGVVGPAVARASSTAVVSATVVLRTAHSAEPLAQAGALSRAARMARQGASTPSAADQADVATDAASLGLTVDAATPWSVVVHGAADAVSRLRSMPEVASVLLAGGPVPVPAAAATQLWGYQLRGAYHGSAAKPAAGNAPTIATIQFSGWDSSQLATYVTQANTLQSTRLPVLPADAYTAVSVAGASTMSGGVVGGDLEVALDQESLYATDPYAQQRAYFAQPDSAGMVAALNRVAADARTMPSLVALSVSWTFCETAFGPDTSSLDAMHQAMANVVSAGVTVFAATDDTGSTCGKTEGASYPGTDPLVVAVGGTTLTLSPTSETPWALSGRGTSVHFSLGAVHRQVPDIAADADPGTGFNVWLNGWTVSGGTSLASPVSAASYASELSALGRVNGGMGDLHSALYSAPGSDFRYINSGDPAGLARTPAYDRWMGLGAPLWDVLVSRLLSQPVIQVPATSSQKVIPVTVTATGGQTFTAWSTGYGPPPSGCSTSTGKPSAPRPVTVPANGTWQIWAVGYVGLRHCFIVSSSTVVGVQPPAQPVAPPVLPVPPPVLPAPPAPPAAPPAAPVTTAPPAAPVTTAPPATVAPPLLTSLADVTPPVLTLSVKRVSAATTALSYTWSASDQGSGLASATVTVYRDGRAVWTSLVQGSGTRRYTGVAGHAYRIRLVGTDVAGNMAGLTTKSLRLPYDDRGFALSKAWQRMVSRSSYGGSCVRSAAKNASASITATGKVFSLLTSTGPAQGMVGVYVDGKHVRDVSLYSRGSHAHVTLLLARFSKAHAHRITLVVRGTHVLHAKGAGVPVDGLLVL